MANRVGLSQERMQCFRPHRGKIEDGPAARALCYFGHRRAYLARSPDKSNDGNLLLSQNAQTSTAMPAVYATRNSKDFLNMRYLLYGLAPASTAKVLTASLSSRVQPSSRERYLSFCRTTSKMWWKTNMGIPNCRYLPLIPNIKHRNPVISRRLRSTFSNPSMPILPLRRLSNGLMSGKITQTAAGSSS